MPHVVDLPLTWSPLNDPPVVLDQQAGGLGWRDRYRVCIYGAGIGRKYAPLDDPSWVVYALNTIPPFDSAGRVRADLWWDIHERVAQSEQDLEWFRRLPVPVFVPEDMTDLGPHCVRFPLEQVVRETADGPFACTFAYQIAYAVSVGMTEIGLFGVELAYGTHRERTLEWASVSWWLGFAAARGVKVTVPQGSRLGRHLFRYGLDYAREIRDAENYSAFVARVHAKASVGG